MISGYEPPSAGHPGPPPGSAGQASDDAVTLPQPPVSPAAGAEPTVPQSVVPPAAAPEPAALPSPPPQPPPVGREQPDTVTLPIGHPDGGQPTEVRPGPRPPQFDPTRFQPPPSPHASPYPPGTGPGGAAPHSGPGYSWPSMAAPPVPVAQPGAPVPAQAAPAVPGGSPVPPAPRGARGWPGVLALVLVVLLIAVTGFQAVQINRLADRLDAAGQRLTQAQADDGTRLERLEGRADALEKQAGNVFNPEAISSAVLPSVFRVRAGDFTGTAFAVGGPASGGGTNLFTNFHVVESVWNSGGREVFLERTEQRFPATIVKVDKENDVAQLRTDSRFTGLVTAATPVRSGQQIVVVGAPLGLTDTVTTGVVSAFREAEGGGGPVIQFDAPINPGNSGGPVINSAKEVVGIATAKARDAEGIGLAVPIKTACDEFEIC